MKHCFFLGVLVTVSLFFSSCVIEEKCWGSSCSDPINFQLIDQITQQDLVFGGSPKFKLDSMQLNKKADFTIGYHSNYLSTVTGDYHYLQTSTGNGSVDTSYLRLTYNDIDTLITAFVVENTECCRQYGGYGKIAGIKYNGKAATKIGNYFKFEK